MRVFDLHCDTISALAESRVNLENSKTAVSLPKAEKVFGCAAESGNACQDGGRSSAYVQCFALFSREDDGGAAAAEWEALYAVFLEQMRRFSDRVMQADSYDGIQTTLASGQICAVLTVENGSVFGDRLERIAPLREAGCLAASLTWNGKNALGGGALCPEAGLSAFGKTAVLEMERCGMFADISHLSDRSTEDFLKVSSAPFLATHSCCRGKTPKARNLPDEYIVEMISRKSLLGINFYKEFIRNPVSGEAGIREIGDHMEHVLKLGGKDILALGSDFDGADMPEALTGVDQVGVLRDAVKERFGEELTEKIFFTNAMDFFRRGFS